MRSGPEVELIELALVGSVWLGSYIRRHQLRALSEGSLVSNYVIERVGHRRLLNGQLLLHLDLLLFLLNKLEELLLLPFLVRLLKGRILFLLVFLTDELFDSSLLLGLEHLKLTSLCLGVAILLWISWEFGRIREVISFCFKLVLFQRIVLFDFEAIRHVV